MSAALTPVPTPAQAAFIVVHEHSVTCPRCKPIWEGDRATFQKCPEVERLVRVWQALSKQRRRI
ncbi:hypothetical protein AB0M11_26715 [Streptomyces sp. NPDC051987]|uniref:hypothetical protein n=1 Tax=Streptomyces sp. NPDC051987 TaxID=3155808 RepID=UPI0034387ED2